MDSKKDAIIQAAIRRLSHFGINKTTMNEIADDVKITKANLYYYFPDKSSLLKEVVLLLSEEFFDKLERRAADRDEKTLLSYLHLFLKVDREYMEDYYMIDVFDFDWINEYNLVELSNDLIEQGRKCISKEIELAMERGEIARGQDAEELAFLFTEMVKGLAMKCNIGTFKGVPDLSNIETLFNLQVKATNLIYYGVKK